jgi:hypothetical protein
MGEREGKKEC